MKNLIKNTNKGYGIIEALFYIAILVMLSLVVINSLFTMTKSFKESTIQADLVQSSMIMERVTREIRQAHGVASISATLLRLNTKDDLDNDKTVQFTLSGTDIQLLENDVLTGNLNTPNIQVTSLSFTEITTPAGKAVKVILSVKSGRDDQNRIVDFYDTVVLRGDYGV
ncbi:hypothetical protein HZA26_02900 [Candidatus Nomurabacteria bacterium]|nr:hypothetical protein [Candidatus Nomurabacteria bacterium]